MKKILFIMLFLATLAGSTNAQNTPDTKLKRTLLFTLGANEEIYRGEYFVFQKLHQNRFACIIDNTLNNTQTFVFNGKRILTADYLHEGYDLFHYLNVHEENGYVVKYEWQEKNYVNIKGKVYGPFDGYLSFAKDNEGNENYDRFYYCKEENGNKNYYIHYDGVKAGPFEIVSFPYKDGAFSDCEYLYALMGKYYAHYSNGTNKMTPFVIDAYNLHLTESGKYAYCYKENGKCYVNINGSPSRGYDIVYSLYFTESGKYAYWYTDNGKSYVNINGNTSSRGYDDYNYLHITESGKYAYRYKDNGKYYVNINGSLSRGYDYVYPLHFTESGKYAYRYKDNGKYYVNINGSPSRGYDEVYDLHFTESGKYAYEYEDNGKWYVNINGSPSRGYDIVYSLHLTESGKYAYRYKDNGKDYVNINGRDYSNAYAMSLDEDGNYIFYFDKDDGKIYKNDNGKETETEFWLGMVYYYYKDQLAIFGNSNKTHYDNKDKNCTSAIEIYSTDHKHSFHSVYKYEYIVIDGERYGRSPALYAWYDKEKNAFIWNSVEGKELVVYEYKLD